MSVHMNATNCAGNASFAFQHLLRAGVVSRHAQVYHHLSRQRSRTTTAHGYSSIQC